MDLGVSYFQSNFRVKNENVENENVVLRFILSQIFTQNFR